MSMGFNLVPTDLEALGLPASGDRLIDGRSMLELLARAAIRPAKTSSISIRKNISTFAASSSSVGGWSVSSTPPTQ